MHYNLIELKKYPIVDYLLTRGVKPVYITEHSAKYFSPFRDENTPSFSVDIRLNEWKDFGTGEVRSDIFDLVQKVENVDSKTSFHRVHVLMNCKESYKILERVTFNVRPNKKLMVISARTLENKDLVKYCESRGINEKLAKGFLYQVHYLNPDDKRFIALGLKNVKDGYEIRSRYKEKDFKACIGEKSFTIFSQIPSSKTLYLFEGMFDFLSAMQIKRISSGANFNLIRADCIILNSVSILGHIDFNAYGKIVLFLDNDDGGKKAAEKVQKENPAIEFQDMAKTYYPNHKDLNAFLLWQQNHKK